MIELTENLLYKLEEKMMALLSDAESMRQQIQRLQQENSALRQEKDGHTRKLQDLVSLLDSVNPVEHAAPSQQYATVMPIVAQG
ncbi:MAG TPA: hypothetical protein VL360_08765 [Gammaproteobacteria bacterium]|jgi:regulator of replication initiation timing|nr:hypothetical protein [Gammaproteobacteria bacterium]